MQIDSKDEFSPSEDGISSSSASDVPDTDTEDEAGYLDKFTDDVKVVIEGLKSVEKKQTLLENEYQRELLQLEKKVSKITTTYHGIPTLPMVLILSHSMRNLQNRCMSGERLS